MIISLEDLGKKFVNQWIFKGLDYTIQVGRPVAITGPNGSGKSTLLKIISGWMLPSQGALSYYVDEKKVINDHFFKYIDYVAPYVEMVEELTLEESIKFHFSHKRISDDLDIDAFLERVYLENNRHKFLRNFSSGMKQRLKLGLGFFSQSPILLLDEPMTNLDSTGKSWYLDQISRLVTEKLIIIASNQSEEYSFVKDIISISDYTHV